MTPGHASQALTAISAREVAKFFRQYSRLVSALVRPALWLIVFALGFQNVFGVSIIPPYETYITYQAYVLPGLLGIVLLFQGMQSSLSMVYDREMGMMRLLLSAPLPRWFLLMCKLAAGTALSVLQAYAFLLVAMLIDVQIPWSGWIYILPTLVLGGLMLGSLGLLLSVYIKQLENFAGTMNFVIFPMFFISSALYPLWKFREAGTYGEYIYWMTQLNPFTHVVELIRFAAYGMFNGPAFAIVVTTLVVFFTAATLGYDPQQGMIRKGPAPAPAT